MTEQLAYECAGSTGQPSIMLLHGFMSCNAQWLMNIEALQSHYHLVMVELWGHGDSPLPDNPEQFTVQAYIEQFEAIRSQLGINRWALVGQSYGAGLLIRYAHARPQTCTRLVVTNSRSALGDITHDGAAKQQLDSKEDAELDLRSLPYHPIHARRFPATVQQALVTKADQIQPAAIKLGGALGRQLNCRDDLHELRAPLLIANGQYEKSFQRDLQQLTKRYPDLNVVNLPGGHSVNIEAADAFNQTVLSFLQP